jgi:hypothetical protein
MALATAAMMVGGTAMQTIGSIKQGREINRQMEDAARERIREAAVIQRMSREKAYGLAQERSSAMGTARALAAKAGVAGPSVKTQRNKIASRYTQKIAFMGLETGHRISKLKREAEELERRGRSAKRAGYWGAGSSLLSGGAMLGKTFDWDKGLVFRT